MENSRVLNSYKLLSMIYSCSMSLMHSSEGIVEPKLDNKLVRKPTFDKLINANSFSDIDDVALNSLKSFKLEKLTVNIIESFF